MLPTPDPHASSNRVYGERAVEMLRDSDLIDALKDADANDDRP